MNREEMIEQIKDLIHDRESFISDDPENSECFRKDKIALEMILEEVENNRICLSGYRESILRKINNNSGTIEDILLENSKLKEEIEQLHRRDTYTNIVHSQFQIEKKEKRYYENILDELEKWLEEKVKIQIGAKTLAEDQPKYMYYLEKQEEYQEIIDKIKELKGE